MSSKRRTHRWVSVRPVIMIVLIGGMATVLGACSSGPATPASSQSAPSHGVTLSLADNHTTVQLHVPATVTVHLPYVVKSPTRWELASGGAGMTLQGQTAVPSKNTTTGTQVFKLAVTAKSTIPLVFVLEKPGPLTPNPKQRFTATLQSS